jgi:RNA polymerase sigma factor (sigma-70 family)
VCGMAVKPPGSTGVTSVAVALPLERWECLLTQLTAGERQAFNRVVDGLPVNVTEGWHDQLVEHSLEEASAAIREELRRRHAQTQQIEQFLRESLKDLLVLAARLVGPSDAKDIVQEACANLMTCSASRLSMDWDSYIIDQGGLSNLMRTIATRRAYDLLRKQYRNREYLATDGAPADFGDSTVMQRVEAALDVAHVQAAYPALPPNQRIVHILHFWYGLTAAECAAALCLGADTRVVKKVEKWISRATESLKCAMEEKS